MKILIIRPYASIVNLNQYNMQQIGLAKALIRHGHDCDVVYWSGNKGEKTEKIDYFGHTINVFWLNGLKIAKDIIYRFKKINEMIDEYDIVQVEEYEQIFSCIMGIKYPEKVVVYHGPYFSKFKKKYICKSAIYDIFFRRLLIKKGVQFIAKSKKANETLARKGIRNVVVSPVGLDLERFAEFNVKKKRERNVVKLLYVGEFSDRRSIDFLIRVLSKVREEGKDARLQLIGNGAEGYVTECKKLAQSLNVLEYVSFCAPVRQDELPRIYSSSDVFLLASKYEIFGMVLLEAMYFGCPVLSTNNAGSETVIRNNENGFIINELDINEWSDLILKIANYEIDINGIITSAHDEILKKYSWDLSSEIFTQVYRNRIGCLNSAKKPHTGE